MLMAGRQERREFRRELNRPGIGCLEEVIVVRERFESLITRLGQFLVAVTDLDTPKTGHAVDDLLAVGIPEVNALPSRDDAHALLVESCGIGERMYVVRRI